MTALKSLEHRLFHLWESISLAIPVRPARNVLDKRTCTLRYNVRASVLPLAAPTRIEPVNPRRPGALRAGAARGSTPQRPRLSSTVWLGASFPFSQCGLRGPRDWVAVASGTVARVAKAHAASLRERRGYTSMLVDSAIELFLDHRRHRSPGTRLQYRRWLTHWRAWCRCHERPNDLASVDIADIRDYLKYLETEHVPYSTGTQRPPMQRRGLMPASVVAARRTLRALWIFLNNEELLTDRQARFFGNNRIPAPEIVEQPRPYCDPATLEALLEACGDGLDETSARNRAILLLLYESGMRIGELCALKND
jgi:hypothetical protein